MASTRRFSAFRQTAMFALALAAAGAPPAAQDRPFLRNEEQFGRPIDGERLRVCIDPRDPAATIDREIAEAIASVLLLELDVYLIPDTRVTAEFDDVYILLRGDCRVVFGFKLITGFYPDWVTATRAYYNANYVFLARSPAPARLGDLPAGTPVAATLGSIADFAFLKYNNTLPAPRRWQRIPLSSDEMSIAALQGSSVDAALVWGPSALATAGDNLAILDPSPVRVSPMPVGALLLSTDSFLRVSIDQAISALIDEGAITRIVESHDAASVLSGF